jgi:hypothetical protein
MPKPIKQAKRPRDVNQWAHQMVEESTREPVANTPTSRETVNITASPTAAQISAFMSEMGRKGGRISGERRLINLTAERRREIALKAARARWGAKPLEK